MVDHSFITHATKCLSNPLLKVHDYISLIVSHYPAGRRVLENSIMTSHFNFWQEIVMTLKKEHNNYPNKRHVRILCTEQQQIYMLDAFGKTALAKS